MKRVLFVCTGNTCRSPMAEAILKQKTNNQLEVKSAGIYANPGSQASEQAIEVLKERGIACDHRSQPLSHELLEWASVVFTMTGNHKQFILSQYPEMGEKIYTLKEFALGNEGFTGDVVDPFGGSVEHYRLTADEIEKMVEKIIKK
ncbi:low molecular weight protein arginine phosphatase [Alkalihalobacterium elongatum]|uniref:low molecular weight protein arginine phosphatase n=1 Tax=Alkalihalobacterium elongatum TaxID=2675466 RepID=UPI001C1FEAD9|nr:low molecular weight protein arginine phosphatase [Alkalihalobacterium elongatum]